MANEIERRYSGRGLHATSLMPGAIMTNLTQFLGPETLERFAKDEGMRRVSKSAAQGAATTVWAAVGREWEGAGGKYLENMRVAPPAPQGRELTIHDDGYKPHAYDATGAKELWELSLRLVGANASLLP